MVKNKEAVEFIKTILNDIMVEELENYSDQGVKVSTHTYDVLKIVYDEILKRYGKLERAKEKVEFFSLIVGVILHDLSKGSIRKRNETLSHSQVMLKKPEYVIKETELFLSRIEDNLNLYLKNEIKKNIVHIVVSHHGKWGKVIPNTEEARLVHEADIYSAKYHRLNPIEANKILNTMLEGLNLDEIAKKFDCTVGVIKDRLKKAKFELELKTTKQLLSYYKNKKKVPIGDEFFTKRIVETDRLIKNVEKYGFKRLILEQPILNYLEDIKIFEEKNK